MNMKILAIEKEIPGVKEEQYELHLKSEALQAWKLYQEGKIRELYFSKDDCAILILECEDENKAAEILNSLPLVKEGLIEFDIIPLLPYPGFGRLF
jgi:hypothetical protein